jgi:HAD superfamily phosphatase (TIGR01668 family)
VSVPSPIVRLLRVCAPRYMVASVCDLSPAVLRRWGIDALMLDLDNTLVPWGADTPPPTVRAWMVSLRDAGVPACVVSNNVSARVRAVAEALCLPAAEGRFKPSADKLRRALRILGSPPERTAMVGDQVFTDVVAGNRLGVPTVLTAPLAPREPGRIRLLRGFERLVLRILARWGIAPQLPVV